MSDVMTMTAQKDSVIEKMMLCGIYIFTLIVNGRSSESFLSHYGSSLLKKRWILFKLICEIVT